MESGVLPEQRSGAQHLGSTRFVRSRNNLLSFCTRPNRRNGAGGDDDDTVRHRYISRDSFLVHIRKLTGRSGGSGKIRTSLLS